MTKKGSKLVCVPCGQEILVTEGGTAYSELWCCGVVMEPTAKPKKKAPAKKKAAAKKKAPAKKKTAAKKKAKKAGGRKKR